MKRLKRILKKTLFISIILVVVLLVIGGIVVWQVAKPSSNPDKPPPIIRILKTLQYIKAAPVYITNVLPPPNLAKKTEEERKKIVLKLLYKLYPEEKEEYFFVLRLFELNLKLMRMGKPVVSTLIDIIKDEKISGLRRTSASSKLTEILETQIIPFDEKLEELQEGEVAVGLISNHQAQNYLKRFYYYANKMVDTKELTDKIISILLSDEDIMTKNYISRCGIILLKKTRDRCLAEVLEENGRNYRVWVWTDEAGRKKAVKIAMDVLEGKYKPDLLPLSLEVSIREGAIRYGGEAHGTVDEEEVREKRERYFIHYAIETLGEARAAEAVPLLCKLLDKFRGDYEEIPITETLAKIGSDEALEIIIKRYREEGIIGTDCIRFLEKSKNKKVIPFLEEIVKTETYEPTRLAAEKTLKKIKRNYGKER